MHLVQTFNRVLYYWLYDEIFTNQLRLFPKDSGVKKGFCSKDNNRQFAVNIGLFQCNRSIMFYLQEKILILCNTINNKHHLMKFMFLFILLFDKKNI